MTEVVCPGKRLGRASEYRAGPGTYVRGTYIYASVVGPKLEQAAADEDGKPYLVVSAVEYCMQTKLDRRLWRVQRTANARMVSTAVGIIRALR